MERWKKCGETWRNVDPIFPLGQISFVISLQRAGKGPWVQGRRKHLKLGGARHFEGTFFLRERGHFLKTKRAILCLLQNLGGARASSAPGSCIYAWVTIDI